MKIIFLMVMTLLVSSLLFAQDLIPRIIPPAPEATSVFKFSEVPVSTYTGLPSISIPIHEIRCKQLTVPINLSYHARGIRVDEMSSRVGLGWSLNYGGMMSRQIRGGADEEPYGYLTQNYYNAVFTDIYTRSNMRQEYYSGSLDMVPDQFMFNANGTSGKFIFNQITKDILLQEYKDITIAKIHDNASDKIHGWILTDAAGNKFYYGISKDGTRKSFDYDHTVESFTFSAVTNNITPLGTDGNTQSISAWHLMEIETPFNEFVHFYYEAADRDEVIYYRHSYDYYDHMSTPKDVVVHFSKVQTYQNQLSRIVYDQGKVVFIPSEAERQDLQGAHALDKIRIFNKTDTVAIKEYELSYHYTTSATNNNQLNYLRGVDPPASKRLFLASIQEKGAVSPEEIPQVVIPGVQPDNQVPPYTFQYNTTPLPNRFSTSQDVWGYYNGANNGQFLTLFTYGTINPDRAVNENLSEAGMLTKMIYPTGGNVEFTYESNIAARPGYMDSLLLPSLHKIEIKQLLDGFIKHPNYLTGAGVYKKDSILIGGGNLQGDVFFEIDLPFCPQGPPENGVEPECAYSVRLKSSTGAYHNLYPFGTAGERARAVSVPPGMYTLEVIQNNPSIEGSLFYVTLEWTEKITSYVQAISDPETQIPGAGKRIKKIEYKGIDTVFVKEYEYLKPNGQPSGVLFGLPGFYSIRETVGAFTVTDSYGCVPGGPFSTYQGNSVGYSHVTEYYGTKDANIGKTEYQFTTPPDYGTYYKFPYHLPIDNEWLRGKNTATRIFKRNPGDYSLVKEIRNNYLYAGSGADHHPFTPGLPEPVHIDSMNVEGSAFEYHVNRTKFWLPLLVFGIQTIDPPVPDPFKVYYQTGGTVDLSSTRETYYEQDIVQLEKETKYYYAYDKHYQVKGIENMQSDSSKVTTVMAYPGDYTQGTDFIDAMKLHNLMSYPVEKVSYRQQSGDYHIISGVLNKYSSSEPGRLEEVSIIDNEEPTALAQFRFSNRPVGELPLSGAPSGFLPYSGYVPRIKYDLYDTKGNILQYSTPDNLPVSYLWGYNQGYPVAEIKNATYEQVLSVLGQTVIDELNAVPGTDAQVRLKLQPLYSHPSLHDAQVTIFTYNTMFGATSITDNNGVTTYYSYDSLGRLKEVEDKDHNLVKQVQYNYKTAD